MNIEMLPMYILEGHEPVLCYDIQEVAAWFVANKRNAPYAKTSTGREYHNGPCRVGFDEVDDAVVSTVFLEGSIAWPNERRPELFETMVQGGDYAGFIEHYSTWDEAEAGHTLTVMALRDGRDPKDVITPRRAPHRLDS